MGSSEKIRFFLKQLSKGVIWLLLLVGIFIVIKNYVNINYLTWLSPVYDQPVLVYLIYSLSELLFGIIPPEIFMIWGLRGGRAAKYVFIVSLLAVISYLAGVIGFYIGLHCRHLPLFSKFKERFLGKYEKYFFRFGSFLIIVAALTPVPFSGTSMLIGSVQFPIKKYLLFAMFRFIRFTAYSFIIWKANMV